MYREKIKDLIKWKASKNRKPLVLKGARQVGKTWLLKEFGSKHYRQTVYVNFEKSKHLSAVFVDEIDINRIIGSLEIASGYKINASDTLLIFDEIQAVPEALTSLKYFYEEAPEYHIITAGSLLGVALHANISFPVGKVDFMELHPLSFMEFLNASGNQRFVEVIKNMDWKLQEIFSSKLTELLKHYYYVGGMPEAVLNYTNSFDFQEVRKIQKQILTAYDLDFSKHSPGTIVPRIRMLWNSVPEQLAKENKKFIYGMIREGARAKEYEFALSRLLDIGLVNKVCRVNKPAMPLKAYEQRNTFKLFMLDVGLMSAMVDMEARVLIDGNKTFTQFKGVLTEQFVLQQMVSMEAFIPYYWTADKGNAEIDFVIQTNGRIVPIEVKAEINLQAKSLKVYIDKFCPDIAFRLSMSKFNKNNILYDLPLYAVSQLLEI
jgi:uncharacterized protein